MEKKYRDIKIKEKTPSVLSSFSMQNKNTDLAETQPPPTSITYP